MPHIALLRGMGAPVDRGLRQARLPSQQDEQPELRLPLQGGLRFLGQMASSEGIEDLELRAVHHLTAHDLGAEFLRMVQTAPTLYAALKAFCRFSYREASYCDFWMVNGAAGVRLYTRFKATDDAKSIRQSEWSQLMTFIAIVRAFAGPDWSPRTMALQSDCPVGGFVSECFPDTHIPLGQKAAWIEVPASMLSLPQHFRCSTQDLQRPAHAGAYQMVEQAEDFPTSLKLLLVSYLREGYPDINLAAEIANTSVRSLQRRLGEVGLSYSDLVQQVRFDLATQMLRDSDISLTDVAYDLGFSEPSSFSRAFRKIAGISPRDYRRQQ